MRLLTAALLLLYLLTPLGLALERLHPSRLRRRRPSWYDGLIQYTTITNCASIIQGYPYLEYGMGAYTGFALTRTTPAHRQTSPITSTWYLAGLGNNCAGGTRSYIDIGLPANTSLAISGANPVVCVYDNVVQSGCPQSLPSSSLNPGYYNVPGDATHGNTWAIVQGHIFEVRIPVNPQPPSPTAPSMARIWAIDGENNGWLAPTEGVYVFSSTPSILYPSPPPLISPPPPLTPRLTCIPMASAAPVISTSVQPALMA